MSALVLYSVASHSPTHTHTHRKFTQPPSRQGNHFKYVNIDLYLISSAVRSKKVCGHGKKSILASIKCSVVLLPACVELFPDGQES